MIILAEDRQLSLPSLFAHEFTKAPLSLCDKDDFELLNQQKKSAVIDYLKEQFSSSFSTSCPITTDRCVLIIDGRSLLEIKPIGHSATVRDYAIQLLQTRINCLFRKYDRIDIVFDTPGNKKEKAFIERHGNESETCNYDLKSDDVLETKYHHFVSNNRAVLAERIRECWCEPAVNNESDSEDDDYLQQTEPNREQTTNFITDDWYLEKDSVAEHMEHSYCKSSTEDDEQQADYHKRRRYVIRNDKQQSSPQQISMPIRAPLSVRNSTEQNLHDSFFKQLSSGCHRRNYKQYDIFADNSDSN
ncbi:unnamed protein product [Didymodactylos carnosus]|uniref:Uncharacterized protein n=1 Tax=Didymodactylos carnosus TaxID=1234261 RepID=A0A815CTG8_9BILA|nr:unnamed protein product [Didymodactylos carnosus]CAF1288779.1 unnamed protein product [Didymodactylos carnosus]CAF3642807.1 unnamed protein product [Didymodactylos carnosus]CAF4092685.1 unnamed protein product [Didymodactylos carnosus]